MSDQTQIQTLGPADPNAGPRAKFYAVSTMILPTLSLLATFGILTNDQVNHIWGICSGVAGLLGLSVAGLAATKTRTQVNNGTFDKAPDNPVQTAFEQIDAIKSHVDQTVDYAQAKVAEGVAAIQGAAAIIPAGTVSGATSGAVGDLVQAMTGRGAEA